MFVVWLPSGVDSCWYSLEEAESRAFYLRGGKFARLCRIYESEPGCSNATAERGVST